MSVTLFAQARAELMARLRSSPDLLGVALYDYTPQTIQGLAVVLTGADPWALGSTLSAPRTRWVITVAAQNFLSRDAWISLERVAAALLDLFPGSQIEGPRAEEWVNGQTLLTCRMTAEVQHETEG